METYNALDYRLNSDLMDKEIPLGRLNLPFYKLEIQYTPRRMTPSLRIPLTSSIPQVEDIIAMPSNNTP